jgi:thymidylate synthase (FAD)
MEVTFGRTHQMVKQEKERFNMIKVTLMDSMGDDLTVVNAARVSFGKQSEGLGFSGTFTTTMTPILHDTDKRLIKYLAKHRHMSPFGHAFASFHVKAPIFVARQLVKHKFLRWNEISRRYVDDEPEFYIPELREAAKDKKQGSGGLIDLSHQQDEVIRHAHIEAAKQYKYLLKTGVSEEQARMVLPQSTMTEWYWSGSLDAFADMCILRCKEDTQLETRIVADEISADMKDLFPIAWEALVL